MPINDGGPAFSHLKELRTEEGRTIIYEARYVSTGMTLRDYFAGQALAGMMANTDYLVSVRDNVGRHPTHVVISNNAYEMADAMIGARDAK